MTIFSLQQTQIVNKPTEHSLVDSNNSIDICDNFRSIIDQLIYN